MQLHQVPGAPVYYVIGRFGIPDAGNEGFTSNAGFVVTQAVDSFTFFEEAYEDADWSAYRDLPAFEDTNRGNAYMIYLEMEAALFDID